jgi:competence protein ComEA
MKKILMLLFLFVVNSMAIATPVNVNSADAKTIADALSGIGQKKAEAIVKYRTEKGPFKTVDDLTNVSGISKKILAKNKNDILLSDAPTPEPATPVAEPNAPAPAPAVEPKKDDQPK